MIFRIVTSIVLAVLLIRYIDRRLQPKHDPTLGGRLVPRGNFEPLPHQVETIEMILERDRKEYLAERAAAAERKRHILDPYMPAERES